MAAIPVPAQARPGKIAVDAGSSVSTSNARMISSCSADPSRQLKLKQELMQLSKILFSERGKSHWINYNGGNISV
jgi:hypothetical protein